MDRRDSGEVQCSGTKTLCFIIFVLLPFDIFIPVSFNFIYFQMLTPVYGDLDATFTEFMAPGVMIS